MKRLLGIGCSVLLLLIQMPTAAAVGTSASSAILMDAQSGRILYEQNAYEPRLIASITKLMTALVALESGHSLEESVTILPEWAGAEGSSIYLRAGEKLSLETLLYGMLLRSGNDAALSVAGYCGGTIEAFVSAMNEKAHQLGMEHSSFANPNGLNAEDHYSTAYDMALLARACLENEVLTKIVQTKSITLDNRTFTNHNKLLWQYDGCIGMKTGYTEKAGRTLVSAASREGMTLICVTLNDPDDWKDHAALLNYGFAKYRSHQALGSEDIICRLPVSGSLLPFCPVVPKEDYFIAVQDSDRVDVSLEWDNVLNAPLRHGDTVGRAVVCLNGKEVTRIDLVAAKTIPCNLAPERKVQNWFKSS